MKKLHSLNMKSSFSLFELILVTLVSSIVIIYSLIFIKELYENNNTQQTQEILKIDLLATKAFLDKKSDFYDDIRYENEVLFYKDSILLENVTNFRIVKEKKFIEINLNLENKISILWVFKI
ncbi:hypothetical protein [Arcobacter sp. YIC-310]|uniref:hypothetical protein n=1 Tax=Arcobacter sp. YIC-310 TaxID=3376632 RepID=UPI003C29B8B0